MKKIFKKLTWRTIGSNFRQFLSVILIVFLASMLFSGFVCNYYTLSGCIGNYFEKTNLADCWLYYNHYDERDDEFFESLPAQYDKRLYFETTLTIAESFASNNGKVYIYDGKICNPYVEKGDWGCVIDKTVAANNNLRINVDEVIFDYEYEYNGVPIVFTFSFIITGTMCLDECADFEVSWPIFLNEDWFMLTLNEKLNNYIKENPELADDEDDENEITQENDESNPNYYKKIVKTVPYNQILLKINDGDGSDEKIDSVIQEVENYYTEQQNLEDGTTSEYISYVKRNMVDSVVKLNLEIEQARKMIYVFPVFFLIVSMLIILTTIDQLVLQEKQKIGTLKSIGVPDKIIFRHYSKFGAVLCAIGSLLGVLFGTIIIPGIMFLRYRMVYSLPNDYIISSLPFYWIFIVIVGIILMGYIVSFIACIKTLKKNAIECLKFQINNSKAIKKEKNNWIKKTIFPIRMAFRNLKIKPLRTIMATIGIAGCVSLLLCGYGIKDTINYSTKYDYEKFIPFDVATTYITDDFDEKLGNVSGITCYDYYEKMTVTAKTESVTSNVSLYVVPKVKKLIKIKIREDEAFISDSVASELKAGVGDIVEISLGGIRKEITITKIIQTSSINAIFVCDNYGFDDVYKIKGVWIKLYNHDKSIVSTLNSINGTNTAVTKQDVIDELENRLSSMTVMTETIKFFAISLAIVVLLNLIFLIIKERVREIATMKVIGKTSINITLSVLFEILFMTAIGYLIGAIFGYPLLILVLSINKIYFLNFVFRIKFLSFISSLLTVLLTIMIMIVYCYYKVLKIDMIESLKSME